MKMLVLLALPA